MADIQQQIADGARPLARVGDVIAHGEAIPANVVRMRDVEDDCWDRIPAGWQLVGSKTLPKVLPHRDYWPMTVVEVDPEPQPEGFDADGYLQLKGTATGDNQLDVPQPAAGWSPARPGDTPGQLVPGEADIPQPVVLSLPQVFEVPQPLPGVTRVTDRHDRPYRWEESNQAWRRETDRCLFTWLHVLVEFGPLTDATPPREPRTWPKIEAAPDDLPRALDLSSHPSGSYPVRWVLDSSHELSGMYVGPLGNHHTLPELRAVGWVTEVVEP